MHIVEFLNEFHISIGFGRWKDRDTRLVKSICLVSQWSTDIFNGKQVDAVTNIGCLVGVKPEEINIPFQFSKDTSKIVWRKNTQAAKWNHNKKVWIVPIMFKQQVYEIGKKCKSSFIQIKDNLPEKVEDIPSLPKLNISIPLKKGSMRSYQEEGVARGLQLKRFINGDQPGLGKTLQSIATVSGAEDIVPTSIVNRVFDLFK